MNNQYILGNTAQFVCGIFRKIYAVNALLFLAIHKVFLRKSAFLRTQIFLKSALAELCGVALDKYAILKENVKR